MPDFLYVEPLESVEVNNHLTELYSEQRREKEKILRKVATDLQPFLPMLNSIMQSLTKFDFIHARHSLANLLEANRWLPMCMVE